MKLFAAYDHKNGRVITGDGKLACLLASDGPPMGLQSTRTNKPFNEKEFWQALRGTFV